MAKLRMEIEADNDGNQVTRQGHKELSARLHTWHTFAYVNVWADGSVHLRIERDGETIFEQNIDPESES